MPDFDQNNLTWMLPQKKHTTGNYILTPVINLTPFLTHIRSHCEHKPESRKAEINSKDEI
jgi:hypothetical protein